MDREEHRPGGRGPRPADERGQESPDQQDTRTVQGDACDVKHCGWRSRRVAHPEQRSTEPCLDPKQRVAYGDVEPAVRLPPELHQVCQSHGIELGIVGDVEMIIPVRPPERRALSKNKEHRNEQHCRRNQPHNARSPAGFHDGLPSAVFSFWGLLVGCSPFFSVSGGCGNARAGSSPSAFA